MPSKFTVFISSTVKDFGPIRRDVREWLEDRGIQVRLSEDPEFHVEPDVHSHEACLKAIEGCHLFILLVGWRWGGNYRETTQSITWREYDEAVRLGIPVIKFVLRDMNEEAIRFAKTPLAVRRKLKNPQIDIRLLPFLDAIRKGKVNNWVHLDWDGSASYLRRVIDARLNSLFVSYQGNHRRLQVEAQRLVAYASARAELDALVALAPSQPVMTRARAIKPTILEEFFDLLQEHRQALFGFEEQDLYNFALYVREGDELKVFVRRAHPDIRKRNRPWRVGEGHVGLAASRGALLVSPNLAHTGAWFARYRSDVHNYVSAISTPLVSRHAMRGEPAGVFIVTSNRPDHFREVTQLEALTALSIGRMLTALGACEQVKP